MVELVSTLVVYLKEPEYKTAVEAKNFLKKKYFVVGMVMNHELTLSSALVKDQHVKAYWHVGRSLGSVVKVN
jgi:hypothetical protein